MNIFLKIMNKKLIIAFIVLVLSLILFSSTLKNFTFNPDIVWKIEEQRREHLYSLTLIAKYIHNKASYVSLSVLENYLSYYSPSTFFCCNQPVIESLILIIFYSAFFILLRYNSAFIRVTLLWILIYPIFPSLMLYRTTFFSLLPLIIPASGVVIYASIRKMKNLFMLK